MNLTDRSSLPGYFSQSQERIKESRLKLTRSPTIGQDLSDKSDITVRVKGFNIFLRPTMADD